MEEVQSAYWNQSMVMVHPVVAYFKKEENNQLVLKHKSFAFISDELSHTASASIREIILLLPVAFGSSTSQRTPERLIHISSTG
jgi:hypothetical protein